MSVDNLSPEQIVTRGQEWYDRHIREQVEPVHDGEFLVINVDTGEYEIDPDDVAASVRAMERFPDAPLYTMRVGRRAAYRLGGRLRPRHHR